MSMEQLTKQTAGVINAVTKQPKWDKDTLYAGIQKILIEKREKAESDEAYLEMLLNNAAFYIGHTNGMNNFLFQSIDKETFYSPDSFKVYLSNLRTMISDPAEIQKIAERQRAFVLKGETVEEKARHGELAYMTTKIVNDLLLDFLTTFYHPNNKEHMQPFMEYSAKVVVETVFKFCNTYASLQIDAIPGKKDLH
ncbi:hypothetical protein ACFO0S_10700 [Chryseomicrobium palamuruense]|uniref:Uncharacterized protein n=1 Tax=Chryseomicrobium palamuruense TaxID=682973 RepID=A0ABV8UW46_9BACL